MVAVAAAGLAAGEVVVGLAAVMEVTLLPVCVCML